MIELLEKGTKTIQCIDCGVEFEVPRMSRTYRCDDCFNKHKKEQKRLELQRYRTKIKNVGVVQSP